MLLIGSFNENSPDLNRPLVTFENAQWFTFSVKSKLEPINCKGAIETVKNGTEKDANGSDTMKAVSTLLLRVKDDIS